MLCTCISHTKKLLYHLSYIPNAMAIQLFSQLYISRPNCHVHFHIFTTQDRSSTQIYIFKSFEIYCFIDGSCNAHEFLRSPTLRGLERQIKKFVQNSLLKSSKRLCASPFYYTSSNLGYESIKRKNIKNIVFNKSSPIRTPKSISSILGLDLPKSLFAKNFSSQEKSHGISLYVF